MNRFWGAILAVAMLLLASGPSQARFLQNDPVGYDDDMDMYTYVKNDPTDKSDPTGRNAIVIGAEIGCAADAETGCVPGAIVGGVIGGGVMLGCALVCEDIIHQDEQGDQPAATGPTAVANPDGTVTGSDGKPIKTSSGGPGAEKKFKPTAPTDKAKTEGKPCVYCGKPMTSEPGKPNSSQQDHGTARSRGGNNSPENNNDSCAKCNQSKGTSDVWEWVKKMFGQ